MKIIFLTFFLALFLIEAKAQNEFKYSLLNPDSVIKYYAEYIKSQNSDRYDLWTLASKTKFPKADFKQEQISSGFNDTIINYSIKKLENVDGFKNFVRYSLRYEYTKDNDSSETIITLKRENFEWRVAYNYLLQKEAQLQTRLNNLKKAIELYKEALIINPLDGECYDYLAQCYFYLKAKDSTISNSIIADNASLAISLEPNNSQHYKTMALYFTSINNSYIAIQYFEKAKQFTKNTEDLAGINSNISSHYYSLKDFNKSEEYAKSSIKLDSSISFSYYTLAKIDLDNKNYLSAKINFEKAIKFKKLENSILSELFSKFSLCCLYLKDCENAKKYFYKAVELQPTNNWNSEYAKDLENCK